MQKLGKTHGIPGQVAMEQIMVCGFRRLLPACMFEIDGGQDAGGFAATVRFSI